MIQSSMINPSNTDYFYEKSFYIFLKLSFCPIEELLIQKQKPISSLTRFLFLHILIHLLPIHPFSVP